MFSSGNMYVFCAGKFIVLQTHGAKSDFLCWIENGLQYLEASISASKGIITLESKSAAPDHVLLVKWTFKLWSLKLLRRLCWTTAVL